MIRVKKILAGWLAACLAASNALPALAQPDPGASTQPAAFNSLLVGDDQVELGLSTPVKYNSFMTANPPRLVLELLDADYQVGARSVAGKGKYLLRVRSGQFQRSPRMVSRVVIDLSEPVKYRVTPSADGLVVALFTGAAPQSLAKREAPAAVPARAPAPQEAARPVAPAPAPAPAPKSAVEQEAGSMSTENSTELGAMAAALQVDKASDDAPAPKAEKAKHKSGAFAVRADIMSRLPRDLVTLDFENTDIREILKLLQAKAKVNVVSGPDVSGNLTLHLSNVPFNEAFRTILTMMGLSTSQVGDNILRVMTPAAVTRERTNQVSVTKVIQLNYTSPASVVAAVSQVATAEGRRTTVLPDLNTNSVVITDTQEGIAAAERLIAQLDVKPKQVLIEAKLIEVQLGRTFSVGIQWGFFEARQMPIAGKTGVTTIGSQAVPVVANAIGGQPFFNDVIPPTGLAAVGANPPNTGVSLPADGALGALTLGRVTDNSVLNMALTAAATQGRLKVLSDPKIATMNNKAANINVTSQLPFATSNVSATGAQTVTINYTTIGITLTVTPTINADNTVTLALNPSVSQPSQIQAAPVSGAPPTDTRSANTTVIVKDGDTIVIGGLISDSLQDVVAKIPFLGDLPVIGWLFKKKTLQRTRKELLIFVTPKIMED